MLPALKALPDLGSQPQGAMSAAAFTLERMAWLMAALGQPQQRYLSLHVAGTNGKGSVSALCSAALQAAGLRVGAFTSPHLHGALEGVTLGDKVVPPAELEASFESLRPHLDRQTGWTQFEVVTALAFHHFSRMGVEAAVIEVGLGGRLDATNVLTPLVSVITPIDYDHLSILGSTLEQIAAEKAGIIKPGVPVVLAPQPAQVSAVIREVAREKKAPIIEAGKDTLYQAQAFDLSAQDFQVWSAARPEEKTALRIALLGRHQIANAATAYAALQAAREQGLALDEEDIRRGFAAARWPGRFEILQSEPTLVLDAAHSPHAARALRQALDDYFPDRPVSLVLGVSADKDLTGIVEPLRPRIAKWVATQSAHPRAMLAAELQRSLAALGLESEVQPDAAAALSETLDAADKGAVVLVAGSVFLVEQVREGIRT